MMTVISRKFKLDVKNPSKLTAAQRKRLAKLAAMPDSKIDYGDIPKQTGDVKWTRPRNPRHTSAQ